MDVGGRLAGAGIIFVVTLIIVVPIWYLSVGLYALGLWPLGALVRVGDWVIGLFGLYWIVYHLRGSHKERLLRFVEERQRMRDEGLLD